MTSSPWPLPGTAPAAAPPLRAAGGPGRGVPPGVGEGFLHDAVGGQLDTGVEGDRGTVQDQPGTGPGRLPGLVEQLVELAKSRLRLTVRHVGLGVLPED